MMNERCAGHLRVEATATTLPDCQLVLTTAVPAGALLRVRASTVTMLFQAAVDQVRAGQSAHALAIVHRFAADDMERNWESNLRRLSMAVVRSEVALPAGAVVTVALHYAKAAGAGANEGPAKAHHRYSDTTWVLGLARVAEPLAETGDDVAAGCRLQFIAGPPTALTSWLTAGGMLGLQHVDGGGNPARASGMAVEVLGAEKPMRLKIASDGPTPPVAVKPVAESGARITVKDAAGRTATANAWPRSLDGTPIYFGEFHWHTEFSGDGQRSLQAALTSSRDELGLDFVGPTDHMGFEGRYSHGTVEQQAAICRAFDVPGRFCTLPGAELSRRIGHANVYCPAFEDLIAITRRFPEFAEAWRSRPNEYGLEILLALCREGRALVVPHHTNIDSHVQERVLRSDGRPFWCAMQWPLPADRRFVRLVEMVQCRGAFETEALAPEWRVLSGGFGGSAQTALMRGYRVGFTGGTDNHCGWPTRAGAEACGLTGVQASTLDPASIFEALRARRCYATTGARIVADATLNGHPMGSELQLAPGAERRFHIRVQGTAPLAAVQVMHAGCVLHDFALGAGAWNFEADWCDERPGRALVDAWYYVRARQVDGHCAWLSPFWVDLPRP